MWISKTALGLRLAVGVLLLSTALSAQSAEPITADKQIREVIIVSASRRDESVQDIALAVSALSGDELARMGADELQDYYRSIPNFAVVDRGPGGRQYSIRGVSSGIVPDGAATVGVYIDEMPVTANGFQPDIKLFDLQRIEVLRGPQGTLYGEGSLGGTVRMITPDPDLDEVRADLSVDYGSTSEGGDNTALNAMLNIPLGDTVAVRVSGYYRDIDGFIDRIAQPAGVQIDISPLVGLPPGTIPAIADTGPIAGREDINDEETTGGRATFLWQANDNLGIKLNFLTQDSEYGGRNTEIQSLGNLETDFVLAEMVDDQLDLKNLTVDYDLGFAKFVSSTSLYERERTQLSDNADLGGQVIPGIKLAGAGTLTEDFQDQFSQEFRLVSTGEDPLDWSVGFFYVDKENGFEQIIVDEQGFFVTLLSTLGVPVTNARQLLDLSGDTDETQFAFYGEGEYHFNDTWSAVFGVRFYDYDLETRIVNNDINILGLGLQDGIYKADESGNNIKVGVNFTPTENALFYFLAAEGFRLGGTNTAPGVPATNITYDPDSLWNYELGAKLSSSDGRVSVNSAIYYIDWTDVQLSLPLGFSFATVNAGEAEVIGLEVELLYHPTDNWDLSLAAGFNKGELTKDVPGATTPGNPNPGFKGDRLPGSPDQNIAASAQYNFQLGALDGSARVDFTYTGSSDTTFNGMSFNGNGDSSHFELDAYSFVNVRVSIGSQRWQATLYADNLLDEEADLLTDNAALTVRVTRNRPRTIGLKVQYNM